MGKSNDRILLKTATAFMDCVRKIKVEVGEGMSVGVDSDSGTCEMED